MCPLPRSSVEEYVASMDQRIKHLLAPQTCQCVPATHFRALESRNSRVLYPHPFGDYHDNTQDTESYGPLALSPPDTVTSSSSAASAGSSSLLTEVRPTRTRSPKSGKPPSKKARTDTQDLKERRRLQNRAAQRRFRVRKQEESRQVVQDLETTKEAVEKLTEACRLLQAENARLRAGAPSWVLANLTVAQMQNTTRKDLAARSTVLAPIRPAPSTPMLALSESISPQPLSSASLFGTLTGQPSPVKGRCVMPIPQTLGTPSASLSFAETYPTSFTAPTPLQPSSVADADVFAQCIGIFEPPLPPSLSGRAYDTTAASFSSPLDDLDNPHSVSPDVWSSMKGVKEEEEGASILSSGLLDDAVVREEVLPEF